MTNASDREHYYSKAESAYDEADAMRAVPSSPSVEASAIAAFRKAQSVYRGEYDHAPLTHSWETTDEAVRQGWRGIASAAIRAAQIPETSAPAVEQVKGPMKGPAATFTYTNWRGETSQRDIRPLYMWFGATEWHPEPQWLITAVDVGKGVERDFALAGFGALSTPSEGRQDLVLPTQREMNEAFYVDVCQAEDRLKEFVETSRKLLASLPAHWHDEAVTDLGDLCDETDAVLNPHMHTPYQVEQATKRYGRSVLVLPGAAEGWLDFRQAPRDGSIIIGRFWTMYDAPNGPYPEYRLMQWDELEDSGWMDPDGLTDIDGYPADFMFVERRPSAPSGEQKP